MQRSCFLAITLLGAALGLTALAQSPPAQQAAASPGEPTLAQLLDRAAVYVADYMRRFSGMVAEESYDQMLKDAPGSRGRNPERILGTRQMRSDFLLVQVPGGDRWTPFRDVFEVNGEAVRDREDRLQKLFLQAAPSSATTRATQISDESARYNMGQVNRTINVPTLPLRFLERDSQARFRFDRRKRETVEGVQTWRVDYRENARPTFIRTSRDAEAKDVYASGSVWLEPDTGRVVRTELNAETNGAKAKTIVTYRSNPAFDIWVPSEMKETYEYEDQVLTATATYSTFRKFQVTTEEKIRDPK